MHKIYSFYLRINPKLKIMFSFYLIPSILIYLILIIFFKLRGSDLFFVLRDLSQSCGNIVSWGFFSNIGIILWSGSASITLFSFFIPSPSKYRKDNSFLLLGSIFSLVLCIDDLFLIHERFIKEELVTVIYITLITALIIKFWKIIRNDFVLFFIPLFMLGNSLIIDNFQGFFPSQLIFTQIIEEGFKFTGIACWLSFWTFVSLKKIKSLNTI